MKHKPAGLFTVVGEEGKREIPYLRKFSKLLKGGDVEVRVDFAIHIHPLDQRTLAISEMSTGYDTTLRVRNPNTGKPIDIHALSMFTSTQLRGLCASALHAGLHKIGHQRFLAALEIASLEARGYAEKSYADA